MSKAKKPTVPPAPSVSRPVAPPAPGSAAELPNATEPRRPFRWRRWFFALALFISLSSTALHLPSLRGALITDDFALVSDYERRGCGPNPLDCFSNLIGHFYYRPMLPATFALGEKFHSPSPIWFHRENLVFHFLAVFVAFFTFRALFRRSLPALIAGTLLSLHPVNVAVTSWIGGRTDTMALGLMALYALGVIKVGRLVRAQRHTRRKTFVVVGVFWLVVSMFALLAAAFTKEQSIGLAFLAPLLAMPLRSRGAATDSVARIRKVRRPRVAARPAYWTAVYLAPIVFFLVVALNIMKELNFDHAGWSPGQHIEMVGRTLCYYAGEFFMPTVNDQHVSTIGPWAAHEYTRAAIGYIAAALWLLLLARRWKDGPTRLCMLWASIAIGPVLNVIPIPNALAAPFRTAVPMFGIAGLLAALLSPAKGDRSDELRFAKLAALYVLVCWYLVITVKDVPNWHNETTYVLAEVKADPNFVCARASLADAEFQRGQYAAAEADFDTCMALLFGKDTPPDQYADMLNAPQMLPVMQSMSTLRYRPLQYIPQVIRERGRTLQALGRYVEAAQNLRAVLTVTPEDSVARDALVACYRALHEDDRADSVQRMEDVLSGRSL